MSMWADRRALARTPDSSNGWGKGRETCRYAHVYAYQNQLHMYRRAHMLFGLNTIMTGGRKENKSERKREKERERKYSNRSEPKQNTILAHHGEVARIAKKSFPPKAHIEPFPLNPPPLLSILQISMGCIFVWTVEDSRYLMTAPHSSSPLSKFSPMRARAV